MKGQCTITPGCGFGVHRASDHPCGQPIHVGDPCSYCGDPTVGDENDMPIPCPACWISFEGLPLADIKGLLAEADLSL